VSYFNNLKRLYELRSFGPLGRARPKVACYRRDARWSFGQIENGLQLKIEDDEACAFTSLKIAEQTGKQHKNNMQAIRKMEPAWEKVQGLKFKLLS